MHRKNKLRVQCYNFIHNEMCKNRGHIPHWSVFVHRVFIRLAKQHLYTSNFTRLIMCQCKETRTAIPSTYYIKNFNEAYVLNYYEDLTPPSNKKHPKKSENTDTAKQKRCRAASTVTEPHTWHKKNPSIQKVSGSALYTSQYTQSEAVFGIASINNCKIRKQKRLRQKYPLGTQSFWRI